MASEHRHSLNTQDDFDRIASQLRGVINLVSCATYAPDGLLADDSIPSACWLADELVEQLAKLFNEERSA